MSKVIKIPTDINNNIHNTLSEKNKSMEREDVKYLKSRGGASKTPIDRKQETVLIFTNSRGAANECESEHNHDNVLQKYEMAEDVIDKNNDSENQEIYWGLSKDCDKNIEINWI